MTEPIEAPILACRALASPVTVDRAARTVEVIWSTGARARNFVPSLGLITDELDMSSNAVRMEGLRSGHAPVLNTHRRGDARDVLGRVTAARLEGGRGHATLQFSAAADVEPVWQRIADGTLRAVSVGYRVHRYDQASDAATGQTIHRAVDWEPSRSPSCPSLWMRPPPCVARARAITAPPPSNPLCLIPPPLRNDPCPRPRPHSPRPHPRRSRRPRRPT